MKIEELGAKRTQLMNEREAIMGKMNQLNDSVNAEKREMNDAEKASFSAMQREFDAKGREIAMLNDSIKAESIEMPKREVSKNQMLREWFGNAKEKVAYVINRDAVTGATTKTTTAGNIPLVIEDIIKPLEKGLIWDKVGLKVATGVKGNLQWPYVGAIEAAIAGEAVPVDATTINITSKPAVPVRLTLGAFISNQAINDNNTNIVANITEQLAMGLKRILNRVAFSHAAFDNNFKGCFANAKSTGTFAASVPTYAELLAMKGKVAAEGCDMSSFAYVMSEAMKATLEATPIDSGSGLMIVQDGKIGGYPVFCTNYINEKANKQADTVEHIGCGCFAYLAANQHGDLRLSIENDGMADGKKVYLNSDWSLTTLFTEAFANYACHA